MHAAVIIDACTLGEMSHPHKTDCRDWAVRLRSKGWIVGIPEIAEYETRRGLMVGSQPGMAKLDEIVAHFGTLPTSRDVLIQAAEFWAQLRTVYGRAGCDNNRLDADVIIAAQARLLAIQKRVPVEIATTNIRHFQALVDKTHIREARPWREISGGS